MDLSKSGTSRHTLPPVNVRQPSIGHHFAPHLVSPQPKTPVPQSPAVPPGKNSHQQHLQPNQQHGQHQQQQQQQPHPHHQQQQQHAPGQPDQAHTSAMSPPSQMPPSQDPVHDLPEELLAKGWRRFWSKREQRCYFFNKFTNQSLWEMPPLGSPVGASRHDPLGIQITEGKPHPGPLPAGSPGAAPVRRKSSLDGHPLSPTITKDMIKGNFWDFIIESNATMQERFPCTCPPPHNDMEILRANLTTKLRQQYDDLCQQRENIRAPKESFNRWLLERKISDKGKDPMLSSDCSDAVSSSMMREIMSDIPIRLYRPNIHSAARRLLNRYAEAAKKMIESRPASSESRKVVKWNAEDTFKWLRTQSMSSIDDCMKRLTHLKEQCGPHLCEAAKPSVESICIKMYKQSRETCNRLLQKHWELLREHQIEEPPPFTRPPSERKMRCYNIQMAVPSPRLPPVDCHEEGSMTCLRYKGEMMKINTSHMKKLDALYQLHCRDDPLRHNFLPRVWCLLRRYQTLFGVGEYEGHGLQGALPVPVFKALNDYFGVTFECFASPLNCYFKQYCSAFPDTDSFFGSRGPILDFYPFSGSFEANPPFGEELMEEMVNHFEKLLDRTQDPLSFIVFIPDWRDPPTNALKMMEASRFKRRQELIPAYEHEYRSGSQHTTSESSVCYRAVHGTLVFFLQNDEGNKQWPPNDEGVNVMLEAAKAPTKRRAREHDDEDVSPPKRLKTDSDNAESEVRQDAAKAASAPRTIDGRQRRDGEDSSPHKRAQMDSDISPRKRHALDDEEISPPKRTRLESDKRTQMGSDSSSRKRPPRDDEEISPPQMTRLESDRTEVASSHSSDWHQGLDFSFTDKKEFNRDPASSMTPLSYSPVVSRQNTMQYVPSSGEREYRRNSPRSVEDYSLPASGVITEAKSDPGDGLSSTAWYQSTKPQDVCSAKASPIKSGISTLYGGSVIMQSSPVEKEDVRWQRHSFSPVKSNSSTSSSPLDTGALKQSSPIKFTNSSAIGSLGTINWIVDTNSKTTPTKTAADYSGSHIASNWTEATRPLEAKPVLSSPFKFESKGGSKWAPAGKPAVGSPERGDTDIDVYEWKDDDDDDAQPLTPSQARKASKALGKGAMKLKAVKRLDSTLSQNQIVSQKSTVVGGRTLRSRRGDAKRN